MDTIACDSFPDKYLTSNHDGQTDSFDHGNNVQPCVIVKMPHYLDSMKQATVRDEVSKNIRWFLAIVSANHINVWNGMEFDRGSVELLVC